MTSSRKITRTLYEVLELDHASDPPPDAAAIKKAYRRLALRWHPDKTGGQTTDEFREISNAYEILSDDTERQQYDARLVRRDKLTSLDVDMREGLEDVFEVVTSREFMGWSLSGRGSERFSELFRQIAGLEAEAWSRGEKKGRKGAELGDFDGIGEEFSPSGFYGAWEAFGTVLTDLDFGDDYDGGYYGMANSSRRARRWVEGEKKKMGKARRREYNDGVRFLVAFVKRRDERWKSWVRVREGERKEREERERREREERERAKREARREAKEREIMMMMNAAEEDEDDEDEDTWWEEDNLYCPVCDKHFKSKGAFENHEKSKKHVEGVLLLLEEEAEENEENEENKKNEERGVMGGLEEGLAELRVHDGGADKSVKNDDVPTKKKYKKKKRRADKVCVG